MADNSIISRVFSNSIILQRPEDGYINATAMCQATNKVFHDYSRLDTSGKFIEALSSDEGIPVSQLIQSKKGNSRIFEQGTWVHPKVAIHLAQWCSPEFAVQVTNWVFDWLSNKQAPRISPQLESLLKADFNAAGYLCLQLEEIQGLLRILAASIKNDGFLDAFHGYPRLLQSINIILEKSIEDAQKFSYRSASIKVFAEKADS